jgi:DNA-binding transcriptional MerR regulator
MSVRVLTLFGEEIIPEQLNAVGRPAKDKKAKGTPVEVIEEPAAMTEDNEVAMQAIDIPNAIPAEDTEMPVKKTGAKKKATLKRRTTAVAAAEPETPKPATTDLLDGWVGDKQYYTIGEVSALFKVNTSHIRFWTNEFELKVRTTRKGDRLYTPEQVREIRGIFHLVKEKKYTISGAKAKLKEKNVTVQSIDLKKSLLHLRNKLLTIRNQLS